MCLSVRIIYQASEDLIEQSSVPNTALLLFPPYKHAPPPSLPLIMSFFPCHFASWTSQNAVAHAKSSEALSFTCCLGVGAGWD